MANVTRALLQPLGTHSKPHKASLALDCAPLPKEELYVTTQSLRHRRNQKGNSLGQVSVKGEIYCQGSSQTKSCHGSSADMKRNFYFQILNVLATTLGKQREKCVVSLCVRSHALLA